LKINIIEPHASKTQPATLPWPRQGGQAGTHTLLHYLLAPLSPPTGRGEEGDLVTRIIYVNSR